MQGLLARARTPEKVADLEAQLAGDPIPAAVAYLWNDFMRLRRRKASSGFGPSPIEWPDIDAYVRLSGRRLAPWEIEIIEDLDGIYLTEMSKKRD